MKDIEIIFDPTNDEQCAIVSDSSLSTPQVIKKLEVWRQNNEH